MKRLLKELFFRLALPTPLPADRAVILMYHSVSDRADYFSSVSPEAFGEHMKYLADKKYEVITLGELVRRLQSKEPLGGAVVITFDDGYEDNLTTVYPVLKQYGFPATIFVTTGLVGKQDKRQMQMLTADQLRTLESSGLFSIEPHTASHPRLSKLAKDAAREEIEQSRTTLETLLGKKCTTFAYPYGDYNAETLEVVRAAGFDAAVTVVEGTVSSTSNLVELPRVSIDRSTTPTQLRGKLSTAVDRYERLKLW
jgi:peptidoglycan/xylan/chitin deacetylase (PgdA/CDA1 family)